MALKVLVTYTMKPGHRAAFLADTAAIRPQVLAEDGCLQYDYYASAEDENKAVLVEEWESRDAQKVHMTQPHMAGIFKAKDDHVEETALELFDF